VITIVTPKASHSDPLTWDFWYNDGWYWGGGWLAAIQFSGTIPIEPMAGDFDATCNVKLPDLAVLAAAWKSQAGDADYNSACDLSTPKDNTVDLLDLLFLLSSGCNTIRYSHPIMESGLFCRHGRI
jgi:hypothetical protein